MPRRKRVKVHGLEAALSETSSVSAGTNNDRLYCPDSDTELTESEHLSPAPRKSKRRKVGPHDGPQ
ncbi:hypothetical protein BDV37DRAFT_159621 [Aspergillus pseudonomiae]|uniref:Uncharacterized protein n=1 Tax=Aspergillus pseudonomiae TaxID=1506151 RepID=A0A5N7D7P1_9EURO|nr:uncharacterized protein BDV37DRAFT_159621 [Aspergillus pseudonomiae]KAE8402470.1 hypothetical protein BDV37DRAFT_159621 [Aspergillus pseudonomiae]